MVYLPKENGKARKVSFAVIVFAVLLWMISALEFKFHAVVQVISVGFMVVGLQILIRYVLSAFRYVVEYSDDGSAVLLIFKGQGSREAKVCHVALDRVVALFKLTDLPKFQEKYGTTANRFNYCQNMGKDAQWVLLFRDGERIIEVRFEPDEAMIGMINSAIGVGEQSGRGFAM